MLRGKWEKKEGIEEELVANWTWSNGGRDPEVVRIEVVLVVGLQVGGEEGVDELGWGNKAGVDELGWEMEGGVDGLGWEIKTGVEKLDWENEEELGSDIWKGNEVSWNMTLLEM